MKLISTGFLLLLAASVHSVPLECEFLIAGNDRISDKLVLLRTIIPTDPEAW